LPSPTPAAGLSGEYIQTAFAFDVVDTVHAEEPTLFDDAMRAQVREMLADAVECEVAFAEDLLDQGVSRMSLPTARVPPACRRPPARPARHRTAIRVEESVRLRWSCRTSRSCPTSSNAGSAYQVGVTGTVVFDDDF
jgi:ribonucleoside-diphosphate reductase beta chain